MPNVASDYEFRMVQNVPNTADLAILGKGDSAWKLGVFDAFDTSVTTFPSLKDNSGSQPSHSGLELFYLIHIWDGVPGFPNSPPYSTTADQLPINDPKEADPDVILEPFEIQNNLPRQSLSNTEQKSLRFEIYRPSTRAVAVSNRFVCFDTSRTQANPSPAPQFNNVGNFRMGVVIAHTELVAASMFSKESLTFFTLYLYKYGDSDYFKRFKQSRASESIGSKFGTHFLILTSFSGGQAYREIFDYTSTVDYDSRVSSFQIASPKNPTLIGFPVTYSDVMAQRGHPNYAFEDLFYTCDNAGPMKTFKFSDGSAREELDMSLKTSSRAWSSDAIPGTPMVLIGYQQNLLVVVDVINLTIKWEKNYPGSQGNFISQVSAFSSHQLLAIAASASKVITVDKLLVKPCALGCASCDNLDTSIFGCTGCLAGLELLADGRCVCPDGAYMDGQSLTCEPCSLECSKCYNFGPNRCMKCSDGYEFDSVEKVCQQVF